MHTKKIGFTTASATPRIGAKTFAYFEVPKRLLSTWIWNSDPSKGSGRRLVLRWRSGTARNDRTIEDLRRMSNHELADIGLSRSDLTLEGIALAGAKRALRQDMISKELSDQPEVDGHGR